MSTTPRHIVMGVALMALVAVAAPTRAQQATAGPGQIKVGVIDVSRLVTDSEAGQAVLANLQTMSEALSADLKVLADELEGIQKEINDGRLALSEARISELQRQLEDKGIAFRRARDDADKRLKDEQAKRFTEIERLIMPIINQVGQERGYTMIFNKFESGLVYAQESVDITDEILRSFDASTRPAAGTGEGDGS